VYVQNGWPRFSCRHNHCGEGAAHEKKTWRDLQDFYDKDRQFHRILDEHDFASNWLIEYVDDGAEDMGTANYDALVEAEQVSADEPDAESPVPHPSKQEPEVQNPVRVKLSQMPESCMYGWLGDAARELETPLGFAYPAVLTVFAAQIKTHPKHVRPTLYTCLIGAIHCGKSETIKRAVEYIHLFEDDAVKWTVPGSDRGLINIFGGKKKDDGNNKGLPEVPKTRLLAQDELRNTIAKANIAGSSLPATLCSLWSQDEAGAADKTGEHVCLVRLNILGGLKADDTEDFAETFGKESTAGLYDRFVYGLAPKGWKYKPWSKEPVRRAPKGCTIRGDIFQMLEEWRDVDTKTRGRLGEIALRIAYITSAANHDSEVTTESMRCALKFVQWQEAIRSAYKAGLGDAIDAQCTNAILTVLEKLEPGVWIRWKDMAAKKNWYRKYGSTVLSRVRDALAKTGVTVEETVEEQDEKGHATGRKRTGRLRLRCDNDDNG
jgi:hypothetical protein